jgi:hypothetical protein
MRNAHKLLLCLVPIAGCSAEEEADPGPRPEPEPRTHFVACGPQAELGDTWEVDLLPSRIELDAEGNIYLEGGLPDGSCDGADLPKSSKGWVSLTKLGPRGDARWVRSWEHEYGESTVGPSGDNLVLLGEDRMQLVRDDGSIATERTRTDGWARVAPTPTGFLLASYYYHDAGGVDVGLPGVGFEPQTSMGIFVLSIERDLTARSVTEVPAATVTRDSPLALLSLEGGDVVTLELEELEHEWGLPREWGLAIERSGTEPWKTTVPLGVDRAPVPTRIFELADDSFVFQLGDTLWRYTNQGELVWTRNYADALALEANERREGYPILASAADGRIVITHQVHEAAGLIQTPDGPVLPDAGDIAFSSIDVASGIPTSSHVMQRGGRQHLIAAAMDRDGALLVSAGSEVEKKRSGFLAKLRLEP